MANAGQWLSTSEPVIPPFFAAVAIEHGYLRYHVNRTVLFAEVKCFCSNNTRLAAVGREHVRQRVLHVVLGRLIDGSYMEVLTLWQ